jgi:transposase
VRGALVQTRSQYVTTIRGLARAAGLLLPKSATTRFVEKVTGSTMDDELRALIAPLVSTLQGLDAEIAQVEARLAQMAQQDPSTALCATAPDLSSRPRTFL